MPDADEDDDLPEPLPTDGLTPRGVHQADQIVADAKAKALRAVEEGQDPEEATAEVLERLLDLRSVERKPEP